MRTKPRPFVRFVVHDAPPTGGYPLEGSPELGVVLARDKEHARELAEAQWPGRLLCIQALGQVFHAPATTRPPKAPTDWALVARINRARKQG